MKVVLLFLVNIAFYLQNLLFLPLFSRALGLEMYGVWSQISAALNLLAPLVLLGLPGAFTRFSAGEGDSHVVAKNYYTALQFIVMTGLVVAALLYGSSGMLSKVFIRAGTEVVGLVQVSCLLLLAQILSRYSITYFSTFQRARAYSVFRLAQPFMTICSAVVVLSLGFGLAETIVSFAAVHLSIFAVSQYLIIREIGVKTPDITRLKPFFLFSLPLLPAEMMNWVIGLSDRYVIGHVYTAVEVGRYSVGYALGMIIMFFYAPFRAFMYPKATELWEKGEDHTLRRVLNYSNKYPLLLSIPAVFGLIALHDPILRAVTGQSLQISVFLIPVVAVGYVFHYLGTAYAAVFQFEKKTKYATYGYGIGAIVNIAGNICLVPVFGIMGAAIVTMATFLLMMLYFMRRSRSFFDIKLEWDYVWKSLAAASVMYAVLYVVEPTMLRFNNLMHLGCSITVGAGTYSLVIWASGAITREEIDYLKGLFRPAT